MIECMADANIYDLIVEREGMVDALERLRSPRRLELVSIGEIEEQLARAPRVKREAINRVPRRRVAAGVFVLGVARLDDARLGSGDAYQRVRGEAGLREVPERTQRNVKRWSSGEMALRWTAAGMLEAERQFRRIIGYRNLATLVVAIERDLTARRHTDTAHAATEEASIVAAM